MCECGRGWGGQSSPRSVGRAGARERRPGPSSMTVIALRTGRATAAPGGAAARTAFCPCGTALSALVHRGTSRVEGRPARGRPARRGTARRRSTRSLGAAPALTLRPCNSAATHAACAAAARARVAGPRGARRPQLRRAATRPAGSTQRCTWPAPPPDTHALTHSLALGVQTKNKHTLARRRHPPDKTGGKRARR